MNALLALGRGTLFGLGLVVPGMTDPAKVLGSLDLAGAWDPSFALVMAGAIAVGLPTFALARRRSVCWLGTPLQLPAARTIDARLVGGSLAFGVGWGLAGFCPGPALVAAPGMGRVEALWFAAGMVAGMGLFPGLERRRARAALAHA